MLEFYLVGELTHMRSMCVGVAETEYTKSHQRERSYPFSHRRRHRGDRAAVFLAVDGTLTLIRRGDQWSPAMIHKDTSLLSRFSLTKSAAKVI